MNILKYKEKEFNISYSLKAAITFERITGTNPLDLNQFVSGQLEPILILGYCMILTANKQEDVPEYEEFIDGLSDIELLTDFVNKTSIELSLFFKTELGDKTNEEENKEEDPKNV